MSKNMSIFDMLRKFLDIKYNNKDLEEIKTIIR